VNERELRRRLEAVRVPGEEEAADRAWLLVRAAYEERERVHWTTSRRRPLLVLVAAGALVIAALTPPGMAVVDRVRDAVGREEPQPALVRLPAAGRLLVETEAGPWVVNEDGSKRLLGDYSGASWSPRGLFVVATSRQRLTTLEPAGGQVRWTLPRSSTGARWSGGGGDTRIAYLSGRALHVVAGDGSPDFVLAPQVAPVPPAWKGDTHILAYAGVDKRVHVVAVDSRKALWRTPRIQGIRGVDFGPRGRLVVITERNAALYGRRGLIRLAATDLPPRNVVLGAVAVGADEVVYAEYDHAADTTALVRAACFAPGPCRLIGPSRIFQGGGRVRDLTLSPDGRWLAATWPAAEQFLFFPLGHPGRVRSVPYVASEFEPDSPLMGTFPRLAGWAPPAS
jgi:hypothetical protein